MSSIYGKGAKGKCDRLFSLIVRSRGACEYCGDSVYEHLQCCHIFSRKYSHTRTHLDNALCMCARDHALFTAAPTEFGLWVLDRIGAERYAELNALRLRTAKFDWAAEAERLKAIWNAIEANA